jgi:hypothetical protein
MSQAEQKARDVEAVVRRVQADHPSVSNDTVAAVAARTYDELAVARVLNYRLILTERRVRRELGSPRTESRFDEDKLSLSYRRQ